MGFELKSRAFSSSGAIPAKYTCDGADLSPPLEWTGAPEGVETFALIADDPDAPVGTWVHWVLFNIPGIANSLPEGVPAEERLEGGAIQGINGFRRIGYGGPCPPPGKPHRYFFKLYALSKKLDLPPGVAKKNLLKSMEGSILGQAELMGMYGR
ncbi:MAG: YbhB/YbcL family Raf kinase inhibitor-like protein [Deltaproteobacteria bacterium]|nr:YbhB/YbcL family Raf kinase inhibitor-like protein [Deltaproteobacteria bacterium]MBW2309441.1 YbhB/YbcL family Raf kinase inhibitor-like protein [Deltaproteobacteria bacterium]